MNRDLFDELLVILIQGSIGETNSRLADLREAHNTRPARALVQPEAVVPITDKLTPHENCREFGCKLGHKPAPTETGRVGKWWAWDKDVDRADYDVLEAERDELRKIVEAVKAVRDGGHTAAYDMRADLERALEGAK